MIRALLLSAAFGLATCGFVTPAAAQITTSVTAEAMSDEIRRGLSWSGGRAAAGGDVQVSLGPIDASARAVTTRSSRRHGGADGVVDLALGTGWDLGAFRVRGEAVGHLFSGARGRLDYVEVGASASYGIGPLYSTIGISFAPSQRAIGSNNFHVYANANAGMPGTPFTILAGVGHSSGKVSDAVRAQRLRPGGDYLNWRLGIEHRSERLTVGVDYTGTNVSHADSFGEFADPKHAGDKLVGRAQITF